MILGLGQLTLEDRLVIIIRALGFTQLSKLLLTAAAGDVGLDVEAVALAFI